MSSFVPAVCFKSGTTQTHKASPGFPLPSGSPSSQVIEMVKVSANTGSSHHLTSAHLFYSKKLSLLNPFTHLHFVDS
jgi:hypothetical protein